MLSALEDMRIVTHACKKAGVSTSTFYRWRKEDIAFDEACDDAIEVGTNLINDMAESVIVSKIQKSDFKASTYWLEHHKDEYKPGFNRIWKDDRQPSRGFIETLHYNARQILRKRTNERPKQGEDISSP